MDFQLKRSCGSWKLTEALTRLSVGRQALSGVDTIRQQVFICRRKSPSFATQAHVLVWPQARNEPTQQTQVTPVPSGPPPELTSRRSSFEITVRTRSWYLRWSSKFGSIHLDKAYLYMKVVWPGTIIFGNFLPMSAVTSTFHMGTNRRANRRADIHSSIQTSRCSSGHPSGDDGLNTSNPSEPCLICVRVYTQDHIGGGHVKRRSMAQSKQRVSLFIIVCNLRLWYLYCLS